MTLPERPLLAPWYRLVEDGDRLLLEHGRAVVVLEGGAVRTLLPALLPLLDGSRTLAEIAGELGPPVLPAVEQALDLLAGHGLLVEGGVDPEDDRHGVAALAAAYALAPTVAAERLRSASVGVVGSSRTAADIARLLRRAGVGSVERLGWRSDGVVDLAVVAASAEEVGGLEEWNALALERGICWLPVRPFDGAAATVGPLVVPGESPCHACVVLRLAGHVEYAADFARIERAPIAVEPGAPLEAIVAGVAAHLALGWVGGHDPRLPGLLHALEAGPPASLASHPVLRVPRCPACSTAERLASPVPWHEGEAA